ncbi:MAG: hypothetical protein A2046_09045 [Bacteroidetes bacterium GWA2_30_7]|nr:MAG: hypothetical protein A2046_09045 [Bacteroidetes bacterium GWA2_30_7]
MNQEFSYRNIWTIAYPIIIGNIAQNVVNITDTAFLGRVGTTELAASAIAGVFYFIFFMIGLGFSTGTQIVAAKKLGEGKPVEIGKYIDNAIYFLAGLSIVLIFLIKFVAPDILSKGVNSADIFEKAKEYLNYRCYGLFFSYINLSISAFYISIGKTKIISLSFIILAVVNIFLDYGMIFGNFGFQPLGIAGAAIASSISEAVATIFLFLYTIYKIDLKKYNLFKFLKIDFSIILELLKISTPVMIQVILSIGAWFYFFMLVEKLGQMELAVSNIIRSIYIVLMIPIWGFASATNTLTSNLIGQGKQNQVFKLIRKSVLLCGLINLFAIIIALLIPEFIIRIYTDDITLINATKPILYTIDFVIFFISSAFIIFNGVIGTSKTLISMFIEIFAMTIYIIFVYIFVYKIQASLQIIWLSELVYALSIGCASILYLRFGKWI